MASVKVFISYAHTDKRWLERLRVHLQPLVDQDQLSVWSDQQLDIGDDWHGTIQASLRDARAAVLLVSPDFLASKYVRNSELPVLLKNAMDEGVVILSVILSHCAFEETKFKYPDPKNGPETLSLSIFQAANPPSEPLDGLNRSKQNKVFLSVARQLLKLAEQSPPPSPAPAPDSSELLAYLDDLVAEANKVPPYYPKDAKLEGVRVRVRVSPERRKFDPALMDEPERARAYAHRFSAEGAAEGKTLDWDTEVRGVVRRGTIVGDPGIGKTWLLKWEMRRHAQEAIRQLAAGLTPSSKLDSAETSFRENLSAKSSLEEGVSPAITVPVFLRLTDVADALAKGAATLEDAVVKSLPPRLSERTRRFIRERLGTENCLLLLDAFDEVSREHREDLLRAMDEWVSRHPSARVFLTSRGVGYATPWRIPDDSETEREMELLPFDNEQIGEFVDAFFAGEPAAARGLRGILDNAPQLRGMAQIPLLLGFLCALYREEQQKPPAQRRNFTTLQKAELYDASLRRLLSGAWHDLPRLLADEEVDDKLELLEQVAFRLFSDGDEPKEQFSMRELRQVTREAYQSLYPTHPLSSQDVIAMIHIWSETDAVLVKAGAGDNPPYLFLHLTFQEYLTACALVQRANREGWGAIADFVGEKVRRAEWQEVIVLLAGKLNKPDPLRQRLLGVIEDRADVAPVRVRIAVAETLGHLGDPRFPVDERTGLILPPLVEIPATAEFLMGCMKEDIKRYKKQLGDRWNEEWAADEQPAHPVALDAYAIGKYPVTYREYEQFVADGGYTEKWRDCWTDGGWKWLQESKQTAPNYWDDPTFHKPNYPVVGVTWFEAVAYCNWLNAKLDAHKGLGYESYHGSLAPCGRYRLPTEAEWEYAARGAARRLWAWEWGDEPLSDEEIARRCNAYLGDNPVSNTTPVGIYSLGVTPSGIFDMAGNVWEWCMDWWDSGYYQQCKKQGVVKNPRGAKKGTYRALRGGSWSNAPHFARACARGGLHPGDGWDRDGGLRLVQCRS